MRNLLMATAALALAGGLVAPASAQQIYGAAGASERRDNAERRENNNTNVAIAGVTGLVVGAALAGNNASVRLYAPGYAYPVYGQSGYGDPRYDPRYAQGGYAYGHANGQWVSISDRAQWLGQRIDRGSQEGTLNRREARSLRQDLSGLESAETRYRRGGLQTWEMADLDKRFDRLAARIQYERTDGDNRSNGRDGRNDRYDRENR